MYALLVLESLAKLVLLRFMPFAVGPFSRAWRCGKAFRVSLDNERS